VEAERKVGGKPRKGRLLGAIFWPRAFLFLLFIPAISIATEKGAKLGLLIVAPRL